MMMVDVLSGILLGLPFGNKVSSMYHDLTEYRNLGQLHIVINPEYFAGLNAFQEGIATTMQDLTILNQLLVLIRFLTLDKEVLKEEEEI